MSTERKCFIKENGLDAVIRKKRGVKRLSIRINRKGDITVTAPYYISFRTAENFLKSKKDWVTKTRNKILEERKQDYFLPGKILETHFHLVSVERSKGKIYSQKLNSSELVIYIPEEEEIGSQKTQNYINKACIELLRKEGKNYLTARTRELAREHQYSIREVKVKNMKTRWGSCSSKNNINLNIHLMRLPFRYIDYVILHELVHTRHKNHSVVFWNELSHVFPEARKASRLIKKINPESIEMIREQ